MENELMFDYTSVGIPFEESQRIFDGIVIYGYEADPPAPTPAPTSPLVIKDDMPFEFSYVPEGYEINTRDAFDRYHSDSISEIVKSPLFIAEFEDWVEAMEKNLSKEDGLNF